MLNSSRRTFVRSTVTALVLGSTFLLAMTSANLYLVFKSQEVANHAILARDVRRAAADLLDAVQAAESGQRGYVITRDPQFLTPYRESIGRMPGRLQTLEDAIKVAADVLPEVKIDRVHLLIEKKVAELDRTIDWVETGNLPEAIKLINDASGLRLMNEIRTDLEFSIRMADDRTQENLDWQTSLADILKFVTAVGFATLVALIGASAHIISRFVREMFSAWQVADQVNQSLEIRVRERTQDLVAANEEIRSFAHIVTHDLRAPLVNIMGFTSEMAKDSDFLAEKVEQFEGTEEEKQRVREILTEDLPESIGFIRASSAKMDGLINAILRISRDGQRLLKMETIDLGALIDRSVDTVRHQIDAADGEITVDGGNLKITSDRMSLEQVLGNLLDNAVKYRDKTRPLRINVRARAVSFTHVEISVSDNGRGIDPKDHERVFELFRRSGKQTEPGEGIGLAHLRTLVRNLGGNVRLESALGQGATFVIRLPKKGQANQMNMESRQA